MYKRQDIIRLKDPNYFVNKMEEKIQNSANLVIDDIRFKNEYDLIKKYNGIIIEVLPRDIIEDTHVSENNTFDVDYSLFSGQIRTKVKSLLI